MVRVYIETYGCQMNMADSELVRSIMCANGFSLTPTLKDADVAFVNTCAIRENAEQRVYGRLGDFKHYKRYNPGLVIGVLGCMAERLRRDLLESESYVDIVIGPDEYRRLPEMVRNAQEGEKGIAVKLSKVETYDDIIPLRTDGISAWVSVMRGCDKFCSFCVVPYTRGRERSRSISGILKEVELLSVQGFKEVTLLGQNVNSYSDNGNDFADLLRKVAAVDSSMRIRFTTSHPQDMSMRLISAIADVDNICKYIHLPVQSGSDRILELMNRTYNGDHFRQLVRTIRERIPGVALSTDIIAGFPTETEEDHSSTLLLIQEIGFEGAFTFKYSPRENTKAQKTLADDVSEETKIRRLNEIIDIQRSITSKANQRLVGLTVEVLIEGTSKKSDKEFVGRTDRNQMVVFPRADAEVGTYRLVKIRRANAATLFGDFEEGARTSHHVPLIHAVA